MRVLKTRLFLGPFKGGQKCIGFRISHRVTPTPTPGRDRNGQKGGSSLYFFV